MPVAARDSFEHLIDYAGLFPPARLPMPEAVDEYVRERDGAQSWMLGRFIVPLSRSGELLAALGPGTSFAVSAIVDADQDHRRWFESTTQMLARLASLRTHERRIGVKAIETRLPALATQRETYDAAIGQFAGLLRSHKLDGLPAYVEVAQDERFEPLLESTMLALSRYGLGAKLRCGGLEAQAFPSVARVAAFLCAASQEHVPFKATAGLHHPLPHRDAQSGFEMHGFLNLLAAAALARIGEPVQLLEDVLKERDPANFSFEEGALRWRDRRFSEADLHTTRCESFVAYGSCSFAEPVQDLIDLGFLPR